MMKIKPNVWAPLLVIFLLTGCETLGFYHQAAMGQWQLMRARVSVDEYLSDPDRAPGVKAKLEAVQTMLTFAESDLGLEVGKRYSSYSELDREFVVWNVFAAEPFSVSGVEWCYPLIGCAPYRGYFSEDDARRFAADLELQGLQTFVGGVPAYSTLGWFNDPLLSTFLSWPEPDVAALLFHELAHSRVWLDGDVTFNESFATAVAKIGVEAFYKAQNDADTYDDWLRRGEDWREMKTMLVALKDKLGQIYTTTKSNHEKELASQKTYHEFRAAYEKRREEMGNGRFDRLVNDSVNNAYLVSVGTYEDWVPSFVCLFERTPGWQDFYAQVEDLAAMTEPDRVQALNECLNEELDTSLL